tara:strand:- start:119 stop:256 length:138 start_codon:yes stop_codon:yes gene_type:complete
MGMLIGWLTKALTEELIPCDSLPITNIAGNLNSVLYKLSPDKLAL